MQLSSSRLSQYQWIASASHSLLEHRLPKLTFHLLVPNMVFGQNTVMLKRLAWKLLVRRHFASLEIPSADYSNKEPAY